MGLEDSLTIVKMEFENRDTWKYDNNTTVLLVLKENLASLLRAALYVSNNCTEPEQLDPLGFIHGMADTLNWVMDNMQLVQKDGDVDGQEEGIEG